MAESSKSVVIVLLKGSNYPTWKLQCHMVLMWEGLWTIVDGTEEALEDADQLVKFNTRKDRVLAIIVLSVEPLLLYLLRDPNDPVAVWNKLSCQVQRRRGQTNCSCEEGFTLSPSRRVAQYRSTSRSCLKFSRNLLLLV